MPPVSEDDAVRTTYLNEEGYNVSYLPTIKSYTARKVAQETNEENDTIEDNDDGASGGTISDGQISSPTFEEEEGEF